MQRKIEVLNEDMQTWREVEFRNLQVGDIFRLWEPVTEKVGERYVFGWRCQSLPEERDGELGCESRNVLWVAGPNMPETTEALTLDLEPAIPPEPKN